VIAGVGGRQGSLDVAAVVAIEAGLDGPPAAAGVVPAGVVPAGAVAAGGRPARALVSAGALAACASSPTILTAGGLSPVGISVRARRDGTGARRQGHSHPQEGDGAQLDEQRTSGGASGEGGTPSHVQLLKVKRFDRGREGSSALEAAKRLAGGEHCCILRAAIPDPIAAPRAVGGYVAVSMGLPPLGAHGGVNGVGRRR